MESWKRYPHGNLVKHSVFWGEKFKFKVSENEKQTNMRMGKGSLTFRSGPHHPGISSVLLLLAHCSW